MPIQNVNVQDPDSQRRAIDQRKLLAARLMAQSAGGVPDEFRGQRVTPEYGIGHGLTALAAGLLGGRELRQANEREAELEAGQRKALADKLRGVVAQPVQPGQPGSGVLQPGQPAPLTAQQEAAIESVNTLPIEQQQELVAQAGMNQLFPEQSQNTAQYESIEGYKLAKSQGYEGTYTDYKREFEARAAAVPSSVQEWQYLQTLPPEQRREFMENKRAGAIQTINGVPTRVGAHGETEPLSTLETEAEAARRLAEEKAKGAVTGEAAGTLEAKGPALESMQYVADEFLKHLPNTETGGPLGFGGMVGGVFDYQDAQRFDNLVQQLSTEARTAFRIPGEGTLSDQEQRQYGIQLPDRRYSPEVNKAIVTDLLARAALRAGQEVPATTLPTNVTEEDVQHTMRIHNLSREEVLRRIASAAAP